METNAGIQQYGHTGTYTELPVWKSLIIAQHGKSELNVFLNYYDYHLYY